MFKKIFSLFKSNDVNKTKDFSLEVGFTKNSLLKQNNQNIDSNFVNIKVLYDIIKKENLLINKRINYMKKYLVVLDTTNRPEVKDRGLAGGLKNFYFVYAQDANEAKIKVLSTFARAPHIVEQIQYSLTVTLMDDILNTLGEQYQLWSYIPFSRAQRFPGQRSVPPGQNLNPVNRDEIIPIKPEDIPKPITPPSKNDVDSELLKETPKSKTTDNLVNENTLDLLKKLIVLLENKNKDGSLNNKITNAIDSISNQTNENENNIDIQKKIMENLKNSKPKHINTIDDPNLFVDVEQQANQEVEKFKNMSPQELEKIQQNIINSIIKEK